MTNLSDVAFIVDCEHKTAPIDESGHYFSVGTPAMRNNTINYAEARRISRETYQMWTRRLTPAAGDLLFAREAPVGPVVRIPQELNVAPGQRTVLIRPDMDKTDARFLFYKMGSPQIQASIQLLTAGSTVAHLNVSDVRSLELGKVPTLPEQQAIGEVLGALDDKIAANRRVLAVLGELSAALTLEASAAGREVSVAELAVRVVRGVAPKYDSAGGVVLNQKCIRDGRVDMSNARRAANVDQMTKKLLRRGDVLVNSTGQGTLGRVARWTLSESPVSVDSHVSIVTLDPHVVDVAFVGTLLLSKEAEIAGLAEGSTGQTELRKAALEALVVKVPDLDIQRRVGQALLAFEERANVCEAENQRLAATRDELLPLLMDGRITVKDAEKIVEEAV